MGNPTGGELRAAFVAEACEVWSDALDDATWARVGMPEAAERNRTWVRTTPEQREVTAVAMGALIDWLDSRRF